MSLEALIVLALIVTPAAVHGQFLGGSVIDVATRLARRDTHVTAVLRALDVASVRTDSWFRDPVQEALLEYKFYPAELPNGRKVRQTVFMPFQLEDR